MRKKAKIIVRFTGNVPRRVVDEFSLFNGKDATMLQLYNLDNQISVDNIALSNCHGMFNGKIGWIAPKDGSNAWWVEVFVK